MNRHNLKRYMMPLFAFFIMFAGARAEGDTVSTWQWMRQYSTKFENIEYSKTDKYIVAQGDEEFYFLSPDNGDTLHKIPVRFINSEKEARYYYGKVSFINNDTEFLIENAGRNTIDCYSTKDFQKVYSLEQVEGKIIYYTVSMDEKLLVARVGEKQLMLWDLATKKVIAKYTQPTPEDEMDGRVLHPGFTPDGSQILATCYSKYKTGTSAAPPFYYSKESKQLIQFNLKLDSIGVFRVQDSFVWSKSGKYILTLNSNVPGSLHEYEVTILDAKSFDVISKFRITASAVKSMFFTNDEEHIVIAYAISENICRVFRIKDGKNTINYLPGTSSNRASISNSGDAIVFCADKYIFKYSFTPTTSIENGYFDNGFISFPNPIQGGGVLKFNQEKPGISKIYISDEKGSMLKEVRNTYFDAGQQAVAIDVSDLANGVYFITVTNDTQKFTEKIIVNR